MEGGLTTEEYMNLFNPDLESVVDIVSIAISIEGQALDLYMRAAEESADEEGRQMLQQMADEEKTHMALLGDLLDKVLATGN
jgi:rubrerythrin